MVARTEVQSNLQQMDVQSPRGPVLYCASKEWT